MHGETVKLVGVQKCLLSSVNLLLSKIIIA